MSDVTIGNSFRQAIVTKYRGPTSSRGSRIVASSWAGRVVIPYDHALSIEAMHDLAARVLCAKFGWVGALAVGGLPDGISRVFVFTDTVQDARDVRGGQ